MAISNYIFIDESGDPGKPYRIDDQGNKIATGSSLYYILSAICLDSCKLFALDNKITEVKHKFGYKKEIKSENISLPLYRELLDIINNLKIPIFYRLIDKTKYKGVFAVDGNRKLHNVFDEYNLKKTVLYAAKTCGFLNSELVIDRAERRLLDGKFDNFNKYLSNNINTKTIRRINYITHVSSEYVYAMQMSDLISGAIKDYFMGRNKDLQKIIDKRLLIRVW
jgi:hypothetical protein